MKKLLLILLFLTFSCAAIAKKKSNGDTIKLSVQERLSRLEARVRKLERRVRLLEPNSEGDQNSPHHNINPTPTYLPDTQ